ncbi:MAG: DUF1553 domain-containing protein, partial [Pirellulaceae bacterium]|nr:DUF1553 domain-containing protein [Pirellulaceae bacterium]
LLAREEYSDYFAMMWADVLRVDREQMKPPAAVAMTRWLQTQFRENTPYDEMVRRIITATGATVDESPAAYFVVHKDAESLSKATSQLFLGVRIECAQCHHHPFERWSQRDYYALAGFFTGVTRQGYGDGSKITWGKGSDLKHPRTGELTPFAPPGEAPLEAASPDVDRRVLLAEWITRADNPFFARMGANRLWAHYFGRGLYEPVDDLRDTNPAANGPLLDALAAHLVEVKFDLKAFSRTLLNSRVYQLQPTPNESNALDEQNFSRAAWKPLPAEVLLDAISQTTEIAEQFNGWPEGYRAVQVWDSRMPSHFFRVFGKPQRVSVCACERTTEPSIAQALHLMNSPESVRKIRHRRGRAARLAGSEMSPAQVIEELYLAALARTPNDAELQLMMEAYRRPGADRRSATEDVLWALLNSKEFIYNH